MDDITSLTWIYEIDPAELIGPEGVSTGGTLWDSTLEEDMKDWALDKAPEWAVKINKRALPNNVVQEFRTWTDNVTREVSFHREKAMYLVTVVKALPRARK